MDSNDAGKPTALAKVVQLYLFIAIVCTYISSASVGQSINITINGNMEIGENGMPWRSYVMGWHESVQSRELYTINRLSRSYV